MKRNPIMAPYGTLSTKCSDVTWYVLSASGGACKISKGHDASWIIQIRACEVSSLKQSVTELGWSKDCWGSRGPVTDVHQTKLEMKWARCSRVGQARFHWVIASLGSLFHFSEVAKTTMNISEPERNESKINIYVPIRARELFSQFLWNIWSQPLLWTWHQHMNE